jgi:hypothetical protein
MNWENIIQKPDKSGIYMVYAEGTCSKKWPEICSAIHIVNFDGETWWTPLRDEITHWMPLPNPPQEE